jgi:hypothetical protein
MLFSLFMTILAIFCSFTIIPMPEARGKICQWQEHQPPAACMQSISAVDI